MAGTKKPAVAEATPSPSPDFAPDALMLRTCDKDGNAHLGFQWPLTVGEIVTAPDWNPAPVCGGGLHGLIGALGDWGLLSSEDDAKWMLCAIMRSEAVPIDDDKIKVPRARVDFVGSRAEVLSRISKTMVDEIFRSAAATTGDGSAAAATGKNSIAAALGPNARAKSNTAIMLARYDDSWNVTHVFAGMVDGVTIKGGVWYELNAEGQPVECAEQN